MGKVKELVRQCWAHWYVRVAVFITVALWTVLHYCFGRALRGAMAEAFLQVSLAAHGSPEAWKVYHWLKTLESLQEWLADLTGFFALGLVLCYLGYSLDAGYHWLRNRRQQSNEQVET